MLGSTLVLGYGIVVPMAACAPGSGPGSTPTPAPTPPSAAASIPPDAERLTVDQGTVGRLADGRAIGLVMVSGAKATIALSGGDDEWNGTLSIRPDETVRRGRWVLLCESTASSSGSARAQVMLAFWSLS